MATSQVAPASFVRRATRVLADILAPRTCVGCGVEGLWCCAECAEVIAWDPNTICAGCEQLSPCGKTCDRCRPRVRLRSVLAATSYDDPVVQELIRTIKYAPAYDVAGTFALFVDHFAETVAGRALRNAVGSGARIVPMPLHPRRLRERGFNQSIAAAIALAEREFGTVADSVLLRTRYGEPQAKKPRDARQRDVIGAFTARGDLRGTTVLLVDDVVTTAATMVAAATALERVGAKAVHGFAIARG